MVELYRDDGLSIYEQAHYRHGEHREEVAQLLSWYRRGPARLLDLGCSGGLHALELARCGYQVVGVDREPSAVELARRRAREQALNARFAVLDLEHESLAALGQFDLIYSIGNVLSHLPKASLPMVLSQIKECCAPNGMILFDLLMIGPQVPDVIREDEHDILWTRQVDRASGRIELQGEFIRFGVIQTFSVWGYTRAEVVQLLKRSGFRSIDYAVTLDFSAQTRAVESAACLKFRAQP